mgnify:CR=1 FL=1
MIVRSEKRSHAEFHSTILGKYMVNQFSCHTGKPRISIIAHRAYGPLARMDTGHIGGVERQTSLMARWFARHGYKVSMITWDEGQPDGLTIEGVRVFKMCRENTGIKGLRFFCPKWTSLCQTLKRADADVYYYNSGGGVLGQIVMWCRRHSRKSIFSVAANRVCDATHMSSAPLRERLLYRYGLRNAHSIIVQTQLQQQMLHEGFGVDSTVIPMPCEGFSTDLNSSAKSITVKGARVLWVGRISEEKRFEWLLDVAERCPQFTFDVVGASNNDSSYARAQMERAGKIPNVKLHGRLLHAELAEFYKRCRVLCCTSEYEGFPNTFLEAWSCGIPVVSTFNPDGIIAKYGLGWTASSIDKIVDGLKTALGSPEKWRTASHAVRSYYLENHTMDATMPKFEKLFSDIIADRDSGSDCT